MTARSPQRMKPPTPPKPQLSTCSNMQTPLSRDNKKSRLSSDMAFSPEPVTMTSMRDLFKEQLDPVIRDMATIKESIDTKKYASSKSFGIGRAQDHSY